jgi:ankyrin repeat protein
MLGIGTGDQPRPLEYPTAMTQTRGFKIVKYVALGIGLLISYVLTSGWNNSPRQDFFQAIEARNISLVRQLISQGADVNQGTPQGATPLHFAARLGQIPLTQLLLEQGADIHAIYQSTWTPMHLAAKGGHVDVAKLLLKYGAVINGTKSTAAPLHIAVQEGHQRMAAFLLANGATVHTPFQEGWTALHVAAQAGDADLTRLLLDAGAPIDATNAIGLTPLHAAALSGRVGMTEYLLSRGATCTTPTQALQQIQTKTIKMVVTALEKILGHCPLSKVS